MSGPRETPDPQVVSPGGLGPCGLSWLFQSHPHKRGSSGNLSEELDLEGVNVYRQTCTHSPMF